MTVEQKFSRGLSVEACGVLVGFSPAGYTSIRIAETLRYEQPLVCGSHHVENLMAWLMP
jgi:hypothetical protein